MKIIGLTGGSGSGKSTVGRYFSKNGFLFIDTDLIAREITKKGQPALDEIKDYFGNVFFEDDSLDRKALGKIVFTNQEKLSVLNKITHKYITAEVLQQIKNAQKENRTGVVIDGAALIESGIHKLCDKTIFITASKDIRLKRIMERDGLSPDEALLRINGQKDDSFYMENCDITLDTSTGEEELSIKVKNLAKELKRD